MFEKCERIEPGKCLRATRIGLENLQRRILPLREQLRKLELAHTRLSNLRFDADEKMARVQRIPAGMTRKKMEAQMSTIMESIKNMSEEDRNELFELLSKGGEIE